MDFSEWLNREIENARLEANHFDDRRLGFGAAATSSTASIKQSSRTSKPSSAAQRAALMHSSDAG